MAPAAACMFLLDCTRRSGSGYIAVFVESFRSNPSGGTEATVVSPWKLFLQQVAEAISRPSLVHEYHITAFSLGTAVTNGWNPEAVVETLAQFSYDAPSHVMAQFVRSCMSCYNQASVLVYGQKAYLQVRTKPVLDGILRDPRVVALCEHTAPIPPSTVGTVRVVHQSDDAAQEIPMPTVAEGGADWAYRVALQDHAASRMLAEILWTAHGLPICHLYNFTNDTSVRSIELVLRPQCKPRQYQLDAVEAALSEDGASSRSGVLLLPCGAGKTLVGVLLAAVVKKTTIVVCAGSVSVEQWKHQFMEWADLAAPAAQVDKDADEEDAASPEHRPTANSEASRGGSRYLSGGSRYQRGGGSGGGRGGVSTVASVRQARPIGAARIACLTGKQKDPITEDTDIVLTTYTMLGVAHQHFVRQRGHHAGGGATDEAPVPAVDRRSSAQGRRRQNPKEALFDRTWGLMVLDEVHMAPAAGFRESISNVVAKTVVGLTATYVREDHRIRDTFHVVGPKLYDISWEELWKQGYLASITCVEVHCPMTLDFLMEYTNRLQLLGMNESRGAQRREDGDGDNRDAGAPSRPSVSAGVAALAAAPMLHAIAAANPNKMLCVWELVHRHLEQHAKILVFCDQIALLKEYAKLLGAPLVYGETSHKDRLMVFSEFQSTQSANVICISRVGDVSVNLPCANVVIQVSAHGGSRRQEAQRLGRILRPKVRQQQGRAAEAFFYSIVSRDTMEVYYASHRTEFLVDQGYHCRLVAFEPPPPAGGRLDALAPSDAAHDAAPSGGGDHSTGFAPSGDAATIKHEALLADMMQDRRLTVGRARPSLNVSLTAGIQAVSTRPFQIRLLAAMVSPWEVRFLQQRTGKGRTVSKRCRDDEAAAATDDDDLGTSDDDGASDDEARHANNLPTSSHLIPSRSRTATEIKLEHAATMAVVNRVNPAGQQPCPSGSALAALTVAADGVVYHELA